MPQIRPVFLLASLIAPLSFSQVSYARNAARCDECHFAPTRFGSGPIIVARVGTLTDGKFVPGEEGGIRHSESASGSDQGTDSIFGERVTLNLLGDGLVEAIDSRDILNNAARQRALSSEIRGIATTVPVLEAETELQVGRFGWKAQHASLMSSCADSLRNELGIRNRLYWDEYPNHRSSATPFDNPDPKTGKTQLESLLDEIRHTTPPERDRHLAAGPDAFQGEELFAQIGCALCHVSTYRTLPAGTVINGGTYRIPDYLGGIVIHPFSDFLLHDVGTGDGIPQAATQQYLDQSTANKFRTPPLWGVRFRSWMMHDGKSVTYHQAIMRHGGEARKVRERYEALPPVQKEQLRAFLNSL